nr:cytochrome c [uncultured Sulfurimonas sp.]
MQLFIVLLLLVLGLNADKLSGKKVYLQNCANCHSINMSGGMGPDFNIVSYKRKVKDIQDYIKDPVKMYEKFGYESNAMPRLPLTGVEVEDVTQYIDSLQSFKEWMKK